MDFLLESDRKNRTWVQLSEWLLLAARVLAIGIVGLLAAKPRAADLLDGFFGGDRVRHLVILDDTCSLQRRDADGTAWEEATAAIDRLATAARRSDDKVLVLCYTDGLVGRELATVLNGENDVLADPLSWQPTEVGTGPTEALERVLALCDDRNNAAPTYAYVFSDFADSTHGEGLAWVQQLESLGQKTQGLVLAACGDHQTANLAVEGITLAPGPVAAGVETRLLVEIVNYSDQPAPETTLTLRRDSQPLTSLPVGPFEANERLTVESPVTFAGVGVHTIEATVPSDRLPADDRGWMAIDMPASQQLLLVDDSERGIESRVFAAALRPSGSTRSGWAPVRNNSLPADGLTDATAVLVLDVERLPASSVTALRDYVRSGGGVLLVLGPRTDAEWFNRSFADGFSEIESFAPWRLGPPTSVPPVNPGSPMFRIAEHPAVRVLSGEKNGFLPLVRANVQRRLATDDEAPTLRTVSQSISPTYHALISRFDGEPLLLESRYGEGRVMALLTTAASGADGSEPWSNLATLPIFPVLANDMAAWLAYDRLLPQSESVGEGAARTDQARSALLRWSDAGEPVTDSGLGSAAPLAPATPGAYRRVIGGVEGSPFAARIDPGESDLRAPSVAVLVDRWSGIATVGRAAELFRDEPTPTSRVPLYAAAFVLMALLAAERWLAYQTSYVASATVTTRGHA